ncbi:hypothetical protein JZ751_015516 [Albula glossodonta]|uniref:Uncharacterized protein n=1 Tax=Albula glossodonta TaxID=121402 RepID=A0A8T2MVT7_9TELE|nr:hypothetical protein JZ751_015516 [Albula glossodonta]
MAPPITACPHGPAHLQVFLKELQQQQLQERLQEMRSQELRRKVTLLQRWFQAHQERRHFLQMRAAAITIQRAWRGVREESRYRAATMIQAAWRVGGWGYGFLTAAPCSRYRSLQDEQGGVAKDKGVGPVTTSCQRSQEGRELQRQHSLGYDTPPPAQVEGQQAAKLDTLDDTVPARKEGEGLPTQPSLRRYENHSGCKDKKERWKERRSEGALLDSSPDLPSLKDRRTRMLICPWLVLFGGQCSLPWPKLVSEGEGGLLSEVGMEVWRNAQAAGAPPLMACLGLAQVRVRLRKRPKRKRRLGHVRSGLMFQSGQRDDSEYWTFPLPPISPAPATPPSHSQPDGPHPKPRVQVRLGHACGLSAC